jgi:xanthosine utilization system XapX-like protein
VQEVGVQAIRGKAKGWGSFATPLLAIVGLLGAYVVLGQWQDLPRFLDSAFAAVHWPIPG